MMKRRGLQPVTDVIAPTEECSWRKRVLCGEVHDDNAWAMGGVAGHAGLFSSAPDLHQFAQEMLRSYYGHSGFVDPALVRLFWDYEPKIEGGSYLLGWQRADRNAELEDCGFSPKAVGHNSFTGCSMWIDPEKASTLVLATNRIHPSRSNKKIRDFRRELFQTVNQALV
jgi:CubicO group peptidase (beta-lactamase class C family)